MTRMNAYPPGSTTADVHHSGTDRWPVPSKWVVGRRDGELVTQDADDMEQARENMRRFLAEQHGKEQGK